MRNCLGDLSIEFICTMFSNFASPTIWDFGVFMAHTLVSVMAVAVMFTQWRMLTKWINHVSGIITSVAMMPSMHAMCAL